MNPGTPAGASRRSRPNTRRAIDRNPCWWRARASRCAACESSADDCRTGEQRAVRRGPRRTEASPAPGQHSCPKCHEGAVPLPPYRQSDVRDEPRKLRVALGEIAAYGGVHEHEAPSGCAPCSPAEPALLWTFSKTFSRNAAGPQGYLPAPKSCGLPPRACRDDTVVSFPTGMTLSPTPLRSGLDIGVDHPGNDTTVRDHALLRCIEPQPTVPPPAPFVHDEDRLGDELLLPDEIRDEPCEDVPIPLRGSPERRTRSLSRERLDRGRRGCLRKHGCRQTTAPMLNMPSKIRFHGLDRSKRNADTLHR